MNASPQQVKLRDIVASEPAEASKVGIGCHYHLVLSLYKALPARPSSSARGRRQSGPD